MNVYPDRKNAEFAFVDQAMTELELSDPPDGFGARVMDRVRRVPRGPRQAVNWHVVALTALLAGAALLISLFNFYNWLEQFSSPARILSLQYEIWYQVQSARMTWQAFLLNLPNLPEMLQNAPLLIAGLVISAAGILLSLVLGIAIRTLAQPDHTTG